MGFVFRNCRSAVDGVSGHIMINKTFASRLPIWVQAILLLVALMAEVQGAEPNQVVIPKDARVGLVLSGGGARGLAHVGVIRVLEAQGIRPHIVTGTSMGSIIGALYASGRSVEEIDTIARNMDWRTALSDASPRRDQPYYYRQLEEGMTTDLRMSISAGGISFPRGAIEGQHLDRVLGDLFSREGVALTFDQLPHQFAAVASDLETGNEVVLDSGVVADAVRASMSIPGAIAPVVLEGHLLVDGGIANNMPVDLARRMGADYIIAVDVSAPLRKGAEIKSLFDVANQTSGVLVQRNTLRQRQNLKPGELLIVPEMEGLSSAAFDSADEIISAGYEAALVAFNMNEEQAELKTEESMFSRATQLPIIDFIEVKNDSPVGDEVIRGMVRQPLGQSLDRELLEKDISRLYGLDYFSVVRYQVTSEAGQRGLVIDAIARETGNSWLKLGLELSDDFRGGSVVGLSSSLRISGLNRYGGTAFTRLQLGTLPEFELRFLQPLDAQLRYFVEPSVGYASEQIDIYFDDLQDQPFSSYQKNERWGSVAMGRLLWDEQAEIRFGVTRQRGQLDFRGGIDILAADSSSGSYDDGFYFARLGWDSLDDLGFPTEGMRWSWTHEQHSKGIGASGNFNRELVDFTFSYSYGGSTLLLEGDAAISDDDDEEFADIPFIGGFLELSGLPPRSRFGRHRALLRTVFYHRLDEDGPLPIGVPVYLGASLEKGNVWLSRDDIGWAEAISAGSVFLGARTPIGPAYLSFGLTEDGDSSLAFYLGQRFR